MNVFRGAFVLLYQIRKDGINNQLRQLRHRPTRFLSIRSLEARVLGENDLHQSGVKRI